MQLILSNSEIVQPSKQPRVAAKPLHFIIVGGGLGGLSAAYGGHIVTVFESASSISEVGAGIQVGL